VLNVDNVESYSLGHCIFHVAFVSIGTVEAYSSETAGTSGASDEAPLKSVADSLKEN
jgi:hypothetical protein